MKRVLISTGVIVALAASAIFAFADIARPKPTPKEPKTVLYTSLEVSTDSKSYEARLQIPRNVLQEIAKEANNTSSDGTSMSERLMHSSTRTVMAGLFMFLAISFAGVWLARSNQRRNVKAIATVLVIAFALSLATVMVRANAGPPASFYWQRLPQNLTQGKPTQAGADIQIVDDDDQSRIKLIVPIKNGGRPSE